MKAVVITQPGLPEVLQVQERQVPQPDLNEVLIQVKAAGVNRPDVAQRKGAYPPPPGAPQDVPGLEVSGIVDQVGGGVSRWKKGDSVCALVPGGGYAEYVIANGNLCLPVPDHITFSQAASLPETVFTVWHNVFQRGQLAEGEHLLVHGGSSGIGITAIQLAKAFGAEVTITAGSDEKCKKCLELGADRSINYKVEDFEQILKEEGVDVILDMIGGEYILKNMRILRTDGRLVFINAMKGGMCELDAIDIMRRRLTITGSTLRNRDNEFKASLASEVEKNVWPLFLQNKFRPVIFKEFPLEKASEAHALMETSKHIGKIVLVV